MTLPTTEMLHDMAVGLDQRPQAEIARTLAEAQIEAARAVLPATEAISTGARALAQAIGRGARLYYVAAGSAGLMAAADALELGGTFSIPADQVRIVMAGGLPTSARMPGDTEDDAGALDGALSALGARDVMIAVSASGATPFTLAAARIAKARGAKVVALANNRGAPLLGLADVAVLLETPPEIVAGSTRLGAATAQKIALNMMSTLMAVELGHIHDGMMVNLTADNAKLRGRALGIVQTISGKDAEVARAALAQAGGAVKPAVLMAAGAGSLAAVLSALEHNNGQLRGALNDLRNHD